MCYSIRIEDLVANALIELSDKTGQRKVSFSKLNEYGSMVVKSLNERQEDAVLLLSRDRTNEFLSNSEKYFLIEANDDDTIISLRDEVTPSEIRKVYRSNTPFNVLLACVKEEVVRVLETKV